MPIEHRERLATAPLEVLGRFADASNATLLVRLTDRDARSLDEISETLGRAPALTDFQTVDLAVYKPRDGERPLWDFPAGTLHRREVAAEMVDRAMGAGLVPDTVLRDDAPFGPGSVQRFVAHDPDLHYFKVRETALTGDDMELRDRLIQLAAFDVVIDNADRKGGHLLVEDGRTSIAERLRAVDHGVTFNVEDKHRTVLWDFAGLPVGDTVMEGLERLLKALNSALGQQLRAFLAEDEVERTRRRAEALRDRGVLPEPSGPRAFPWPLV